jgi:sugar O-acyltransferase (sialic acid O-acetyltransferase NeuD family)
MIDVVFWGAGGQARVLRELCDDARLVALFDNDVGVVSPFADVPLFHGRDGFERWRASWRGGVVHCLVAVGGERGLERVALQREMERAGLVPMIARHRTAFVAASAQLGAGTQILAQAAVAVDAVLGLACIVNTGATIDHECRLGDGVHLAPGAHLAGCVQIGDGAFLGVGAAVLPRVRIGAGARVGAGAVVTRDVPAGVTFVGNPAREKTGHE